MKKNNNTDIVADILGAILKFFAAGIKQVVVNKKLLIVVGTLIIVAGAIMYFSDGIIATLGIESGALRLLLNGAIVVPVLVILIIGACVKEESYDEAFKTIKFTNKAGEVPVLLSKKKDGKKTILKFRGRGIAAAEWRENWGELEAALNVNIVRIRGDTNSKNAVYLETVAATEGIPTKERWDPAYISDKDFEICVGQGILDPVRINLDKYPHALFAGATGSGKSVLLRCVLFQAIIKGAKPFMIDFKGGIELGAFEPFGIMVYQRNQALEVLKSLTWELNQRTELFREVGVKNLTEYNRKFPRDKLARVVLACDEVSEMLDKTGLSGADAKVFSAIEAELSTIARLGRAPGINMLLGTQRPDANVISGQIRNNLPIRIAGYVTDEHASKMILGNTKAASLGDIQGRMLYSLGADTYEFQAYLFEDEDIKVGDYLVGRLLSDATGAADYAGYVDDEEDLEDVENTEHADDDNDNDNEDYDITPVF